MYRTHTCGELRMNHVGEEVILSGWVQASRDFGALTFIDLRDRYGITQLVFNQEDDAELADRARELGREFVIQAKGKVRERSNKNPNRATGDIEIEVKELKVLNASAVPPRRCRVTVSASMAVGSVPKARRRRPASARRWTALTFSGLGRVSSAPR